MGERRAPTTTIPVLLFGGMLDGHRTEIPLDRYGEPPLERQFVAYAMCTVPYRLAARRPDGVYVYVPLYSR